MKTPIKYCIKFFVLFLFTSQTVYGLGGGGDDSNDDDTTVYANPCLDGGAYVKKDPLLCHAWGLEWVVGDEEVNPGGGAMDVVRTANGFTSILDSVETLEENKISDWRLPNIRELSKMFRYTPKLDDNGQYVTEVGNTALAYSGSRYWFADKYFETTANNYVQLSSGTNINNNIEPYLVSSTYRDVDLDEDNGIAQFLAMNLMTGAIASFDQNGNFCGVLGSDGSCNAAVTRDPAVNPFIVVAVRTYTP